MLTYAPVPAAAGRDDLLRIDRDGIRQTAVDQKRSCGEARKKVMHRLLWQQQADVRGFARECLRKFRFVGCLKV
jgi:hypothetical protein